MKRVIKFTVKMKLLPLLATAASTVDPQPCRAFTNKVHINALLSRSNRKHAALRNSTTCKKKGMAVCMYSYFGASPVALLSVIYISRRGQNAYISTQTFC